jgi:mannose-6-phosphate isomerase-like protein (cupin superfamily)
MEAMNFLKQLEQVTEYWSPRVVGRVNDQFIKVAKLKGTLAWHRHDDEDELFYIVKGQLVIEYEDSQVELGEGDFHVVPKGVMHNPFAKEECWIALIEPVTTKHTGDVIIDKTKSIEEQLGACAVDGDQT